MPKKVASGARKRYDEKHPIISIRVSAEVHDRLKTVLTKQNKSFGDFLRESLQVEERDYKEARKRGYKQGYEDAKKKYAIRLFCYACHDPIIITTPRLKSEIADSYNKLALHSDCPVPEGIDIENFIILNAKKRR